MVDFRSLRRNKGTVKVIEPWEIFRRLPKPPGINDLYTSQAEVLNKWFGLRQKSDLVLKLHTGGGKTLVGLLIANSILNETGEPVLYLTPTVQLVKQTIEKAKLHGIPAVAYENRQPLNEDFVNGNAIMISTYNALFNGKSKLGLHGSGQYQSVAAIILDDAHAAFSVVRDSFTLDVKSDSERDKYKSLTGLFRNSFQAIDKLGTFDDIIDGSDYNILEVPYWAWHEKIDAVREHLKSDSDKHAFVWPMLRDQLHLCHAFVSKKAFTITPILPLVNIFPTFLNAPRRIYMSATIADDSEIIRTFDANSESVRKNLLTSRSLAGISERMILIPDLTSLNPNSREPIEELIEWAANELNLGVIILVSSDKRAEGWKTVAKVAKGSQEVEKFIIDLQERTTSGPIVFANRYDGIDLPSDSCRLLVMGGLPEGTSNYELFRASALHGSITITRMLAQRIEQGMGRGARGSGDHCAIILADKDLAGWVSKDANFRFLTSATKSQIEIGIDISRKITDFDDLKQTIKKSFDRDKDWTEYHAETLADLVDETVPNDTQFDQACAERKAFNLWHDGYHEKAITTIEKELKTIDNLDKQTRGWMNQLAARIADQWGNHKQAEELQQQAFADNRNLLRPKVTPPYRPLVAPGPQSQAIVTQIKNYQIEGKTRNGI